MPPKKATTRKRIATVKFKEEELRLLLIMLGKLEYAGDFSSTTEVFKQTQKKLRDAENEFTKYT